MKRLWSVPVLLLGLSFHAASAQSIAKGCPPGAFLAPGIPDQTKAVQDACQKTVDVFQFLAPQLATLISGGNATLGQGGALGQGHFVIDLRVNAIRARLPRVDEVTPSITGAQASDYTLKTQAAPLPTIDAAVGIFNGLPLGVTNVLALDVLASVTIMKDFSGDNISLTTEGGAFKLGWGGRLGILQESIVTPGVAVTYLRRQLPIVDIVGTSGQDQLAVRGFDAHVDSWRVTAGKNLILFSLAVGGGQDRSSTETAVEANVTRGALTFNSGPIQQKQTLTRTNLFADLTFNLPIVKIVGEVGRASGGNVAATYNTFSGKSPNDAITYGSIGLRIGF